MFKADDTCQSRRYIWCHSHNVGANYVCLKASASCKLFLLLWDSIKVICEIQSYGNQLNEHNM